MSFQFDATVYNPVTSSNYVTPTPDCVLMGKIVEIRQQANKAQNGVNTFVDVEILGSSIAENDKHIGGKVSMCFALQNPSQDAVRIATSRLANLVYTLGLRQVNDESEMYDIPFMLVVTPQKQIGANGETRVDFNTYLTAQGQVLTSANGDFANYAGKYAPHVEMLLNKMNGNVGMAQPVEQAQPVAPAQPVQQQWQPQSQPVQQWQQPQAPQPAQAAPTAPWGSK